MSIPLSVFDELRRKVSTRSVVKETVHLKKAGKNWKGCCPFHIEETPSLYVYEDGFHCFGCGAHGDVIKFVALRDSVSDVIAARSLADKIGLAIENDRKSDVVVSANPVTPVTRLDEWSKGMTIFKDGGIEAILGTAAKILVRKGQRLEAALLANGNASIIHLSHDNWNGGQDTFRLYLAVAAETYLELENKEQIEKNIAEALVLPMNAISDTEFFEVSLTTALENDPEWRRRTQEHLTGKGITNQGRVRSDNVASIEHKGLRFRSRPELFFHMAMGSTGLPFAPLPVVVVGGTQPRRIEPDFVMWSQGVTMLVEIDGDNFHLEKPVEAHARLKFLLDEGVFLERINATECNTEEKARHAVARIVETINKRKAAK